VLNADYLIVPEERIKDVEPLLTVAAGKVTYAAKPFDAFAPPVLPTVSPAWSPVPTSADTRTGSRRNDPLCDHHAS
jgi:hypothetical protein